jgi:hypothetical protein
MSSWVVRKFSFVVATGNNFAVVKNHSAHWHVAMCEGKARFIKGNLHGFKMNV